MYEGDSGAPKERFVTIEELETAGLIGTKIQQGFALISEAAGAPVPTVASTSTTVVSTPSGGGGGVVGSTTFVGLTDTSVAGISAGQGVIWNGSALVPTPFPVFNIATASKYDMLFRTSTAWKHTDQVLQWNPDLGYLQLANNHSINWLDSDGVSTELLNLAGSTPGGTPVPDPDIDSVVLLVTGEEAAAGAQVFTDSTGRHTVDGTREIGTSISELSTEQAKFGTQSMKVFDDIGAGNDSGFNVADGTDFDFTTGNPDFTVEFHRYTPNVTGTAIATIGQWQIAVGGLSWKISVLTNADPGTSSSVTVNVSTDGSTSNLTYTFNGLCTLAPIKTDTWAHIALVRDGNTARIFVDGTQIATKDWTGLVLHNSTYDFVMGGAAETTGSSDDVYLDNVRVTKGVARYTENFTPPGVPYDGSFGSEAFTVGDPAKDTVIDGLTTTISSADTVIEGDVTHKAVLIPQLHGTHTGEVTGPEALVLDVTSITNRGTIVADSADEVSLKDDSDGTLRKTSLNSITDGGYF
jgi:hypothetical protein